MPDKEELYKKLVASARTAKGRALSILESGRIRDAVDIWFARGWPGDPTWTLTNGPEWMKAWIVALDPAVWPEIIVTEGTPEELARAAIAGRLDTANMTTAQLRDAQIGLERALGSLGLGKIEQGAVSRGLDQVNAEIRVYTQGEKPTREREAIEALGPPPSGAPPTRAPAPAPETTEEEDQTEYGKLLAKQLADLTPIVEDLLKNMPRPNDPEFRNPDGSVDEMRYADAVAAYTTLSTPLIDRYQSLQDELRKSVSPEMLASIGLTESQTTYYGSLIDQIATAKTQGKLDFERLKANDAYQQAKDLRDEAITRGGLDEAIRHNKELEAADKSRQRLEFIQNIATDPTLLANFATTTWGMDMLRDMGLLEILPREIPAQLQEAFPGAVPGRPGVAAVPTTAGSPEQYKESMVALKAQYDRQYQDAVDELDQLIAEGAAPSAIAGARQAVAALEPTARLHLVAASVQSQNVSVGSPAQAATPVSVSQTRPLSAQSFRQLTPALQRDYFTISALAGQTPETVAQQIEAHRPASFRAPKARRRFTR